MGRSGNTRYHATAKAMSTCEIPGPGRTKTRSISCPEPAEGFHRYAQFKSLSETHGSIGSSAARVPDRPGCGRSKVQG